MKRKLHLLLISTVFCSASAMAGVTGNTTTQFKGGAFDLTGYLNQAASDVGPVQPKPTKVMIKGGAFDLNGYLNQATAANITTPNAGKQTHVAHTNLHVNPNLHFVPKPELL